MLKKKKNENYHQPPHIHLHKKGSAKLKKWKLLSNSVYSN